MFLEPSPKLNLEILFDNFEIIRNEYLRYKENNYFVDFDNIDELLVSATPPKTNFHWQVVPLVHKKKKWPQTEYFKDILADSPTTDLILKLNIVPTLATFSLLLPNSGLPPHADHDDEREIDNQYTPWYRRKTSMVKYHLALDIPTDGVSTITSQDEVRVLKNKDLNCFDESYMHSVRNESLTESRGVLILSYFRSYLYDE